MRHPIPTNIKEAKPEGTHQVLAYGSNGWDVCRYRHRPSEHLEHMREDWRNEDGSKHPGVTHWMELPPRPTSTPNRTV